MVCRSDVGLNSFAVSVKALALLSTGTALRFLTSLLLQPKDESTPLRKSEQSLHFAPSDAPAPATGPIVSGESPTRRPVPLQPPPPPPPPQPLITSELTNLSKILLVSVPSALAFGLVCFLVYPFSSSSSKPDVGQPVSVVPVNIVTWSWTSEDLGDVASRTLVGLSTTSYLNLDKILSLLEKPRFSQEAALPVFIYLPENRLERFTTGQDQGQIEPWVSNLGKNKEAYDFDAILKPLEEVKRTTEEAQRTSSTAFTFENSNQDVSTRSLKNMRTTSIKETNQWATSAQVPTPALLPGIVAFGLRLERKQKQKLAS
jgi:hypothetical protein